MRFLMCNEDVLLKAIACDSIHNPLSLTNAQGSFEPFGDMEVMVCPLLKGFSTALIPH